MFRGESRFIWGRPGWPAMRYDLTALTPAVAATSRLEGVLMGRLAGVGLGLRNQASLVALTQDVLKTSEIEGELLNAASVRSSLARRLGVDIGALAPVDRQVEGVVDMVLDATTHHAAPLSAERLFAWHAGLFPSGLSGLSIVRVGGWRDDATGAMQVVSGPDHRRKVHFQAPPAARLELEMGRFLAWVNAATPEPPVLKAGLAHLWFVTIHPFDDGNGRIARAIGDLFLARSDGSAQRFYSLSAQIQRERKSYYEILERTQKGSLDVTPWLEWFLVALQRALADAASTLDAVLAKSLFWQGAALIPLNERQIRMLNKLLDGFEGKLTSGKWSVITKCSPDTALRDIVDLVEKGLLRKMESGRRSTAYELRA
jgi:Fic family protein